MVWRQRIVSNEKHTRATYGFGRFWILADKTWRSVGQCAGMVARRAEWPFDAIQLRR